MEDGFARQVSMDTLASHWGHDPFLRPRNLAFAEWNVAASHFIRSVDLLFPGSMPGMPLIISCTGGAAQPGLIHQ